MNSIFPSGCIAFNYLLEWTDSFKIELFIKIEEARSLNVNQFVKIDSMLQYAISRMGNAIMKGMAET